MSNTSPTLAQLEQKDTFIRRHIGPGKGEIEEMLSAIGASSLDDLIEQTVPAGIALPEPLKCGEGATEVEALSELKAVAQKNKINRSFIGMGYYDTHVPNVILRNVLENPGWYTAYTPYQAEIAQGRLEALLNFQTMVTDLTGMELANASLLDESTAAAEAMILLFAVRDRDQKKADVNKFFVSDLVLPQTIDLLETRAVPIGIELVIGNEAEYNLTNDYFGALLQYPAKNGKITDIKSFIEKANAVNIKVAVCADILSLIKLEAPGKFGADVVVGTTQRFGIPMGYGGPHAAYFATKEAYKRDIPGRIIGVTKDKNGNLALRMALQTREQHIKRDKATSNICTAQVLLAVMAGMDAVYHGPRGLKFIANKVNNSAAALSKALKDLGIEQTNAYFFDTIQIKADAVKTKYEAEKKEVNFHYPDTNTVTISINETTSISDLNEIISIFEKVTETTTSPIETLETNDTIPDHLQRETEFLTLDVFNSYHSETELMRYIKRLERKDLALNQSMISLGSCTMKLNAAAEMLPLSNPNWGNIHPFAPVNQPIGYKLVLNAF